jgi:adenylate cyclase, class 2
MSTEVEAKYRVEGHAQVRQRLAEASARPAGRVLEANTFFDWPDGSLRREDRGLRIRTTRPIDDRNNLLADGPQRTTLTYKGPRQPGKWKIRQEIELVVDDAAAAKAFLEALGMQPTLTFEKRRESWELGGCAVELDELPHLGPFVEIEGADEAIARVSQMLGLAERPTEKNTYSTLLHELAGQRHLGTEIRFPEIPRRA